MKSSAEYAASVHQKAAARLRMRARRRRVAGLSMVCVLCAFGAASIPHAIRNRAFSKDTGVLSTNQITAGIRPDSAGHTECISAEQDESVTELPHFSNYGTLLQYLEANADPHWAAAPVPVLPEEYRLTQLYYSASNRSICADYASESDYVSCTVFLADSALPEAPPPSSDYYCASNGAYLSKTTDGVGGWYHSDAGTVVFALTGTDSTRSYTRLIDAVSFVSLADRSDME